MAWRLDLSDQPLHAVHFLAGDPPLLAVWLSPSEVWYYGVLDGAYYGEAQIVLPHPLDLVSESWRDFVVSLYAPNDAYLPHVDSGDVTISTSYDGRVRLCWERGARLMLDMDGQRAVLAAQRDVPFVAVAMDRDLGTVAALDAARTVYFYQQHVYVGRYTLTEISGSPRLFVPDAAGQIVIAHETGITVVDSAGQVQATLAATTPIGYAACSPEGEFIAMADRDTPLLRICDAQLQTLYQGSARDLFQETHALQLLPCELSPISRVTALAVSDVGDLAFALEGSVVCTSVDVLPAVPRQGALF
jgi:hypothetical protein